MSKIPKFPGPLTARGAVLAVLLSDADQTGARREVEVVRPVIL